MNLRTLLDRARTRLVPGIGLASGLLAIVLAVLVVDFGINSVLFERQSANIVNAEEVTRVSEHLLVARQVLESTPRGQRAAEARRLSTARSYVGWHDGAADIVADPALDPLKTKMIAAEPGLADADLRLRLEPFGFGGGIAGSARLADGSAIAFRSSAISPWSMNLGLLLRFSLPSAVLLLVAWWLVQRSFKPLYGLVEATSRVGTADMNHLSETGQREVRQLIRAFNAMHERIHQLLTNRTRTLLAIGHDLRTPMARMQLRLDSAEIDDETRSALAADITEMDDLLQSLHAYIESGKERGPMEPVDLASLVRAQIDEAADRGFEASYRGPATLVIETHPLGLRRAVSNLVQNALRYAGNVEAVLRESGSWVELSVHDRGPGIPEAQLAQAIEPFTRLDEARARSTRGMGLGLSIVDRIVDAEGGQFRLANRPEGGLVATIGLPLRCARPSSDRKTL
ncbi:MAG TPA: ATP-binding protein [Novosphingobium sp.]